MNFHTLLGVLAILVLGAVALSFDDLLADPAQDDIDEEADDRADERAPETAAEAAPAQPITHGVAA